ncbi:MAG: sortase domain-containing protein [Candidatus Limnocylindrales bacterium]
MEKLATTLRGLAWRVAGALLVAGGVTLIAAGLMAYSPPAAGIGADGSAVASGGPSSTASPAVGASATPGPSGSGASPGSPTPSPGLGQGVPTRVVMPALGIDLGVYPDDYPGGVTYPLCDAAQYFIPTASNEAEKLGLPGQPGRTTYLYAHARTGMFLPLLTQSQTNDGAAMLGDVIQVYTADGHVYLYEVFQVKRHTRDFTLAAKVTPSAEWLILQTSEGPNYTYPKLQVAASLLTVQPADAAAITPSTTPAPSCPK